jgi:hypothetical protein
MTEDRLVVRLTIDLTSDVAQLVELLLLTLKNEIAEGGTIKLGDIAVPNSLLRALRRVQRAVLHDCRGSEGSQSLRVHHARDATIAGERGRDDVLEPATRIVGLNAGPNEGP